jgi:UDP-N-acetylglucosamine--N-acetylmuramyl-(pentapeptide) pyrophosphoryl-undecaprenol N-acetylglucosamine transferase
MSRILKDFRPDVVIGTGGFVCGPVIYAAGLLKIPTLIQEGNSYAGKTIKFLSERSNKVVINFKETEKYHGIKRLNFLICPFK